jgi:L-asparaginase II
VNQLSANPVIATAMRGGIVESFHRGAFCISHITGGVIARSGETDRPVFPRSAIKAFQCLPLLQSGAADHFALNDEEIALCCASHAGEPDHVRVARAILARANVPETCLVCGAHLPGNREAAEALVLAGQQPQAIHNNCSGKHAGMLALAKYQRAPLEGYMATDHPVQVAIAGLLSNYTDYDVASAPCGIDGCSLPTWAIPLENLALAFARLPTTQAGERVIAAVRANPFMIDGTGGFDTVIMSKIPRLFIKYGAEAVYCGSIPHAGLGFALKCDDGGKRAVEVAIAGILATLPCWTPEEADALGEHATVLRPNWRGLPAAEIRAVT